MAVGKEFRGSLWVDGQFTVRVRGPGWEPGRIVRIRRPFARIGQLPGSEIRIDDPSVEERHALLILDRRGILGVDLLSRSGTRFAGAAGGSSWLGAGDILEIAGRRVELLQLKIDGKTIDPPLAADDPLADDPASELVELRLEPVDFPGPPWLVGSALAFAGRAEACAIRIDDPSASMTHCALLRGPSSAHVIDLLGHRTLLNDQPVVGASSLLDGDILTIGQTRFGIRIDQLPSSSHMINPVSSSVVARFADVFSSMSSPSVEILEVLRQFQADTATLLAAQIARIEALNHEIMLLREELRGRPGPTTPPALPLQLHLTPPPGPSEESATWLLDRLNTLETESRSTWKDLLGRITSSPTGPSRASTRPETPIEGQS